MKGGGRGSAGRSAPRGAQEWHTAAVMADRLEAAVARCASMHPSRG
jgi:hypothetical protein